MKLRFTGNFTSVIMVMLKIMPLGKYPFQHEAAAVSAVAFFMPAENAGYFYLKEVEE